MSALYSKIKEDQLAFRKSGATTNAKALTYLLGEIGRQRTLDTSDKAVLAVIKTTVKRLADAQDKAPSEAGLRELQTLRCYVPKELSGVELGAKISSLKFSSIGEAMRQIKEWNIPVNMQEASKLVRSRLN